MKICNKLPANNILQLERVKSVFLSKLFFITAFFCIFHIYLYKHIFHCIFSFICYQPKWAKGRGETSEVEVWILSFTLGRKRQIVSTHKFISPRADRSPAPQLQPSYFCFFLKPLYLHAKIRKNDIVQMVKLKCLSSQKNSCPFQQ